MASITTLRRKKANKCSASWILGGILFMVLIIMSGGMLLLLARISSLERTNYEMTKMGMNNRNPVADQEMQQQNYLRHPQPNTAFAPPNGHDLPPPKPNGSKGFVPPRPDEGFRGEFPGFGNPDFPNLGEMMARHDVDLERFQQHEIPHRSHDHHRREHDPHQRHQEDFKNPPPAAAAARGGGTDLMKKKKPDGSAGTFPYLGSAPPSSLEEIRETWSPPGGSRFSEYTAGSSPYIITDELRKKSDILARQRRELVRDAMKFAWKGYSEHAMGMDEVKPQSGRGQNNWGGLGVTLVDSLDTLWIMGLKEEFWSARDWVRDHLTHDKNHAVSVFETTIRSLGGLLAAYDWSQDETFLDHALDLGKRLIKAFDTSPQPKIPHGMINLQTARGSPIGWSGGNAILAEFCSIQLEFRNLDHFVGTEETSAMRKRTEDIFELFENDLATPNGLYPYFVSFHGDVPRWGNDKLTFGAMADSAYEYMLKVWIQGGKKESIYRELYDKAMDGMHNELLQESTPSGLVFIADKNNGRMDTKMDHLVCFMGGLLALGAYTDPQGMSSPRAQRDLTTAKALTYTCYQMYARMETGIAPEWIKFRPDNDFMIGPGSPHYLLRPETVESLYILNKITGDPIYREWGWEIFQSIEKYCKAKIGYGALSNVGNTNQAPRDEMESFFLGETMKYLYLLFDPDSEVDPLRKHVFNTEAHPTRVFA